MESVEYRLVPGFPRNRVGDDGSVWGRGRHGTGEWRRLKPSPTPKGYLFVCMWSGPKKFTKYVHRVVLEAFVGPCPPGMECLHGDDDKSNNRLGNLRWGTHQENAADTARGGKLRGHKSYSKLTAEKVYEMRCLYATGDYTYADLGEMFGVVYQTVHMVVKRATWKHVA